MLKKIGIITACFFAVVFALLSFAERIVFSYQRDGGLRHASRYFIPTSDKEVIFIPMSHLNSKEFNSELRSFLEQKKNEGYVVFREGIFPSFHLTDTTAFLSVLEAKRMYGFSTSIKEDSISTIQALYKQRKILNFTPDWSNPESALVLKSFYKDSNLVNFPLTDEASENEIWVDFTTGDLVRRYEAACGPVNLSEYDLRIPLGAPYIRDPNDSTTYFKSEYSSYHREDLLRQKLISSPWPKVVLVYGAAHISQMKIYFDSDKTEFVKDKHYKTK